MSFHYLKYFKKVLILLFLFSSNIAFSEISKESLFAYKFDIDEASYAAKVNFEGKSFEVSKLNFSKNDNISLIYKKQNLSKAGSFEISISIENLLNKINAASKLPLSFNKLKTKPLLIYATLIDYKDACIENSSSSNFEDLFIKSLEKPGKSPFLMSLNPWDFENNFSSGIVGNASETEGGKMTVHFISNKTDWVLNSDLKNLSKEEDVPFLNYNIQAGGGSSLLLGFSQQLLAGKSLNNKSFDLILKLENLGELSFQGSFN